MSVSVQGQAILASLRPLFEQAEAEGLWFFHLSHDAGEVWCSPEYLRLQQSRGEMLWSAEHWELRSPVAYMKTLQRQAEAAVDEYNDMAKRLSQDSRLKLTRLSGSEPAAKEA
jgi:hypothetical protein